MLRIHIYALAALGVLSLSICIGFFTILPDTVPVHWGINGEPDRYGSKWELIVLGPIFAIIFPAFMAGLFSLGPMKKNIEDSRVVLGRIIILVSAMFIAFHVLSLLSATGRKIDIGSSTSVILGTMFAFLGNWLGKVRRNFWLGVRTPWTLINDVVWEKTNRFTARIFVLHGLLCIVLGFVAPAWICFIFVIGGLLSVCLISTIYSYRVYQQIGEPSS